MQGKSSLKFADRLKRAMADNGLKAARLAEKAEISKGYMSELMKGTKGAPSFDVCKKFADVLQCSPRWLLFGVEEDQDSSPRVIEDSPGYGKKNVADLEPTLAEVFDLLRQALDKLEEIITKGAKS